MWATRCSKGRLLKGSGSAWGQMVPTTLQLPGCIQCNDAIEQLLSNLTRRCHPFHLHPTSIRAFTLVVSPHQALQQLEGQSPLPHLFMRTVIVALQTHPKLMGTILGILTNMINKEVCVCVLNESETGE